MAEPAVLFVCLGNICRSPMAEGAFRAAAARAGLAVKTDSAGTADYHVGEPPDPRAIAMAAKNGVDISDLRGRQLVPEDFRRFDHILVMDHANLRNARKIMPADAKTEPRLLTDRIPGREGSAVDDPWYGETDAFAVTWALVTAAADELVRQLKA